MRCEKCNAEIMPDYAVCPECGTPVSRKLQGAESITLKNNRAVKKNVPGFDNTIMITERLSKIVEEQGRDIVTDPTKFVALLNDYIPECEKERRLFRNVISAGVLKNMLKEQNQEISVMKAKSYMTDDMFLSENAAEFVVVCFAHVLGWNYVPRAVEKEEPKHSEETAPTETPVKKSDEKINIEARVFRKKDANKFRLKSDIVIPEGYTMIDSFCFDGWGRIRSVELPSTMAGIGEYAFSECKHLRSINFPESIKVIRQNAFAQCIELAMVKIPSGILEIPDNAFQFCRSLEIIDIPNTVSSIGKEAFAGCDSLGKLFLPDSVKFIDENAFSYCPNLTIKCYENSYVHKYCLTYGITFDAIAKGPAIKI